MKLEKFGRKYTSITKAAEILHIDVDDLLYAGAEGQIQVCVAHDLLEITDELSCWSFEELPTTNHPYVYPMKVDDFVGPLARNHFEEGPQCALEDAVECFQQWEAGGRRAIHDALVVVPKRALRKLESGRVHAVQISSCFIYKRDAPALAYFGLEDGGIKICREELLITSEEIQRIKDTETSLAKPLSTKERGTLLRIIGLLCKEARIDYNTPSSSADVILNIADKAGVEIAKRTIQNYLKEVPEALGARMK